MTDAEIEAAQAYRGKKKQRQPDRRKKQGVFVAIIGARKKPKKGKKSPRSHKPPTPRPEKSPKEHKYGSASGSARAPLPGESEYYRRVTDEFLSTLVGLSDELKDVTPVSFLDSFTDMDLSEYPPMLAYRDNRTGAVLTEPCMTLYESSGIQCDSVQCQFDRSFGMTQNKLLGLTEAQMDVVNVTPGGREMVRFLQLVSEDHVGSLMSACRVFCFWLHNEHYGLGLNSLVQDTQESQSFLNTRAAFAFAVGNNGHNTFIEPFTDALNTQLRQHGGITGAIPSITQLCSTVSKHERIAHPNSPADRARITERIGEIMAMLRAEDKLGPDVPIRNRVATRDHRHSHRRRTNVPWEDWVLSTDGEIAMYISNRYATKNDMCRFIVSASRVYQHRNPEHLDYEVMSFDPAEEWMSDDQAHGELDDAPVHRRASNAHHDSHGTANLLHRLVVAVQLFFAVVDAYCMNQNIFRGAHVRAPMGSAQRLSNLNEHGQRYRVTGGPDRGPDMALITELATLVATRLRAGKTIENALFRFMHTRLNYPQFKTTQKTQIVRVYREVYIKQSCALYGGDGPSAYDHLEEVLINLPLNPDKCFATYMEHFVGLPLTLMAKVLRFLRILVTGEGAERNRFSRDLQRIERIVANLSYDGMVIPTRGVYAGLRFLETLVVPMTANIQVAASRAAHISTLKAADRLSNIHDVDTPLDIKPLNNRAYRC